MINIQDYLNKLPEQARPIAAQYLPVFLQFTAQQFADVTAMLLAGDTEAPLRAALAAMTPEQLNADTDAFTAQLHADGDANAANVKAQREFAKNVASIVFAGVLALAGV